MKYLRWLTLVCAVAMLSACVTPPQQPISFAAESVSAKSGRVGIAMSPLSKPDTYLPGADCLLCIAFASAANSSLTTHTKTLTTEELSTLKTQMADALKKRGAEVVMIKEDLIMKDFPDAASSKEPNFARKDFSALQKKYQIDKLVVIDLTQVGMHRAYSAYIPASDPKGYVFGQAYLVNLQSKKYEWFVPIDVKKSADGKWDEPPKFPGLTNAYFQALESARDTVLKPLAN